MSDAEVPDAAQKSDPITEMIGGKNGRQDRQESQFVFHGAMDRSRKVREKVSDQERTSRPPSRVPDQPRHSERTKSSHEPPGHQMADRSWPLVFLNHADFPVAVLQVLAKQRRQRSPWVVPTPDLRGLPNLSSAADNAEIVFVILITTELLVEAAEAIKGLFPPAAIGHGIHVTFIIHIVKTSAPDRERRVIGCGDSLLHVGIRLGACRTADVVRAGPLQRFHAPNHVVGSINSMRVHADHDLALCLAKRCVQADGNDASGIVDNPENLIPRGCLRENLAGAIVRKAVGYQHFKISRQQFLGKYIAKAGFDVPPLVPTRQDDRNFGPGAHASRTGEAGFAVREEQSDGGATEEDFENGPQSVQ